MSHSYILRTKARKGSVGEVYMKAMITLEKVEKDKEK